MSREAKNQALDELIKVAERSMLAKFKKDPEQDKVVEETSADSDYNVDSETMELMDFYSSIEG